MQRFILSASVIFLLLSPMLAAEGVEFFKGSWAELLAEAEAQNKNIFVDAYTTWCGPCKKMNSQVFPQKEVGDFFNKYFISYKLDMEKGEGPGFAKTYAVRAFPTFLFFKPDGKIVKTIKGYKPAHVLISEGEKALFNEDKLKALNQEFKKGNNDPAFLVDLIEYRKFGRKNIDDVAKAFVKTQTKEELAKPKNIELIFQNTREVNSIFFDLMIADLPSYYEHYDSTSVDFKIKRSAGRSIADAIELKDEKLLDKVCDGLSHINDEKKEYIIWQFKLRYYEKTRDWKNYAKTADAQVDLEAKGTSKLLNSLAYHISENCKGKKYQEQALKYIERSVEQKMDFYNLDTFAHVLSRLGKNKEAKKWAEMAITNAKTNKLDSSKTQKLLDELNQGNSSSKKK